MAVPTEIKGLSLCSGYDGFGLGISLVLPGYRTICHVEREIYASAILASKMEEGLIHQAPIWDSVETFDGKPWNRKVDILTAGFPCQPWSPAGKQKGLKDKRWLWPSISRIVKEMQPSFVFLENHPGLVSGGGFGVIENDLRKSGYSLPRPTYAKACYLGTPHQRRRIFILAYLHSDGLQLKRVKKILSEIRTPFGNNSNGCCENVGDLLRSGRWQISQSSTDSKEEIRKSKSFDIANSASTALGHLHCTGLEGENRERSRKKQSCKSVRTIFPPGRSIEKWEGIPTSYQPCISRMVDGDPTWLDQVRASGMGVVPGVVACSLVELLACSYRDIVGELVL